MKSFCIVSASLAALTWLALTGCVASSDNFKSEPGFVSLFNGKNLTGWGYRTNHFDGRRSSGDGRYTAKDGILTVHPREPRLEQTLWTT
ncbi:MAG: DUF1080 domain-containing protein, partial [Verrucomicrobiota bacterium]